MNVSVELRPRSSPLCAVAHDPARPLDAEIVRAVWLTRAEIVGRRDRLRTPLVLRCLDDYLAGRRFPLAVIADLAGLP